MLDETPMPDPPVITRVIRAPRIRPVQAPLPDHVNVPTQTPVASLDEIKHKLRKNFTLESPTEQGTEQKRNMNLALCDWTDALFEYYVRGSITDQDMKLLLQDCSSQVRSKLLELTAATGGDHSKIDSAIGLGESLLSTSKTFDTPMPESAKAFDLYNPSLARTKHINSFEDQLALMMSPLVGKELAQFVQDNDPKHLERIVNLVQLGNYARELYSEFSNYNERNVGEIAKRLKYTGLNMNLVVSGDNSELIMGISKAMEFGSLTSEDRGVDGRGMTPDEKKAREQDLTPKNRIDIDLNDDRIITTTPLYTPVNDAKGEPIKPTQDVNLSTLIRDVVTDPDLIQIQNSYMDDPEATAIVNWVARQAVVRQVLPRDSEIAQRTIQLRTKVKDLGGEKTSDPDYQASNPIALYIDEKTNKKFIVKQCPDETLQADYFGLEMLKLFGVPTYEFYMGEIDTPKGVKKVLVSGFLDGFQDPSALVRDQIAKDAPKGFAKTVLPEHLKGSRTIQQAMLLEILIGEYNTKAHNFMVLGNSVQHIDQGACLSSTASGKFKGFSSEISLQDVQDVIHCYADWDSDLLMPVNEAYARVAQVEGGKLVIKDVDMATRLLKQLQRIPQSKFDDTLEAAGYQNGPASIDRMKKWQERIKTELLVRYQTQAKKEQAEHGHVLARTEQYLRWCNGALATFDQAIGMGGELNYYKFALTQRRTGLEKMWGDAIEEAKEK